MIIGVSVTKQSSWRGINEQFSNVYNYDTGIDITAEQVLDGVVSEERKIFGDNVTFVKAQAWGPVDGTPAQSQMLNQKTLTGVGAVVTGAIAAKELAAVVEWDTGRVNSRGGKIFFRKYLHVCKLPATFGEAALGNTVMDSSSINLYLAFGNGVKNVAGVNGASICDKRGRKLPLNTSPKVLPHLHTRQFRR
jgi:hypothetical protein